MRGGERRSEREKKMRAGKRERVREREKVRGGERERAFNAYTVPIKTRPPLRLTNF